MKAFVFAAAGALALLAAAPASAATGYVGAAYSHDSVDVPKAKSDDLDIFGVEGAVAFNATQSLGLDVDASYSDGDNIDSTWTGAAHLYLKGSGYKVGGFAGVADAKTTTWSVGVEGQRNFGQTTIAGAVGYANDDDANADAWGADGEVRYFLSDNFRIAGRAGYANISPDKGKDDDLWRVGVNAEYQLASVPVSFRAGYDHSEFDNSNVSDDAFTVGVRYNWGPSLKDRDENGPSFAGLSSLTGAF